MNPRLLEMEQSLNQYRSGRGATAQPAAPTATSTPTAPVAAPVAPQSGIGADLEKYRADRSAGNVRTRAPREPGLFDKLGGRYNDAMSDVKEQGKDLLTGGGPVAAARLFVKPLADVVRGGGDIIDAGIKALPGNVEEKVADFVRPVVEPIANKVMPVYDQFKEKHPEIASDLEDILAVAELYPAGKAVGLAAKPVKEIGGEILEGAAGPVRGAAQRHFTTVNEKDIVRPTTINEPKYNKATQIYNDAKQRGIDLEKVATERGILHDNIAEGRAYNSAESADALRENNYKLGTDVIRPAIAAVEPSVQRVPIRTVRNAMLAKIDALPDSVVTPEDRAWMRNQIITRYDDASPAAERYADGFTLTNLYDNRIVSQKNGKYKPGGDHSQTIRSELAREEARVFGELFDQSAPKELGLDAARKEFEKNFLLADYLDALHSKKIPDGITKKAIRLFGRAITATVGGKIGGFPGSILGAQYGDMLFSTFEALPNPIKAAVLNTIKRESPAIFKELQDFIGKAEVEAIMRPKLPAAGGSSFRPENPRLFSTPGGAVTPSMQEAVDAAAVEGGAARTPTTDPRRLKQKIQEAQENIGPYVPPGELPVIKAGRKPKRLFNGPIIDIDQ